jgi:eukaryotic-like serine/threonine-protein kinase
MDGKPMNIEKSNSNPEWLPKYIGKYKILQIVGMGGMGIIYKALQESLNRIVALKVLPPQFCSNEEVAHRFEIEAKAISMLQHQNIVNIYEYGCEDGMRYFAMQFVDGENLSGIIHKKKILSIQEVIDYSKQICRGLRYAHAQNIIHRDIKPHNILVDKENVARLTDFGIAKIFSSVGNLTLTGVTVGTPEYMSPEQAEGNDVDVQTDIYSLGIVMYEMLTKKPPFTANNPIAIAYKHVHELPISPSIKRRDTPKRLELIILKALKKKKFDRYDSAAEMLEHLDSVNLNELVDHSTVTFLPSAEVKQAAQEAGISDKRITDRRGGERRRFHTSVLKSLGDGEYWKDLLSYQWPSLLLFMALAAILACHILMHK